MRNLARTHSRVEFGHHAVICTELVRFSYVESLSGVGYDWTYKCAAIVGSGYCSGDLSASMYAAEKEARLFLEAQPPKFSGPVYAAYAKTTGKGLVIQAVKNKFVETGMEFETYAAAQEFVANLPKTQ